ncbi:MAG: hypothetical protein HY343_02435 [Lentisphaerae bacterium]|nr:hypothetical protein [Lentisphaerota bacterium]
MAQAITRTPIPKEAVFVSGYGDGGPHPDPRSWVIRDVAEGCLFLSCCCLWVAQGAYDGQNWIFLRIPADQVTNFVAVLVQTPGWKPLPLPPELEGGAKMLARLSRTETIPIEGAQGYYLFRDSQEKWNRDGNSGYHTEKPFHERPSQNFTFALFDVRTGMLYVRRIDT